MSLTGSVHAEEGGSGHYAPGTYLDFSAMPPAEPGFHFVNYFMDYANGHADTGRELPLGGNLAAGVTANVRAETPGIIYAYPWRPADVTFSSAAYPSWIWQRIEAAATFDRNGNKISGAIEESASGFGDIRVTPIMVGWTNGDFTLGGMFNVWAPSGAYQVGRLANPGLGYWTFELMPAFSWLSSKTGTEFTVFPAVDFNLKNTSTDYRSGDIFHVDATLAQRLPLFGGYLSGGGSTTYVRQITADSGPGARLDGFKVERLTAGPTISYVHKLGRTTLVLDGSWLPQVRAVNTTVGNYFWARLTFTF